MNDEKHIERHLDSNVANIGGTNHWSFNRSNTKEYAMKLFGQVIRTVVNTALVPVAVVKDIYTLGGTITGKSTPYTIAQLEKLADEAKEE